MAANFGLGPGFVTHCASFGCNNIQLKGNPDNITFHTFPRDKSRCRVWLTKCGRKDLLAKGSNLRPKSYRLCSKHFPDDQYLNKTRRRLNLDAVPSGFSNTIDITDCLMNIESQQLSSLNTAACASYTCDSIQIKGHKDSVTFHYFPKDKKLCTFWILKCGRKDLLTKSPDLLHKSYRLCSKHFTDEQYSNTLRKRLNPNAVPSVFPEITAFIGKIPMNQKPKLDECLCQNSVLNSAVRNIPEKCVTSVARTTVADSKDPFSDLSSTSQVIGGSPSIGPKINHQMPPHTTSTSISSNVGRNGVKFPPSVLNKKETEVGPKTNACGVDSVVCPHYIAFIEEKAKSHGLQREVEHLKEALEVVKEESKCEVESLKEDIRTLNQMLIQRSVNPDDDIDIKEEKIEFKPFDVFS